MNGTSRLRDDQGASLVIVLIIVTVLGMVSGVTLSEGDTSIRATLALRDQAGTAYSADGAAQIALNRLRNSVFANDTASATYPKCFGNTASSDTLSLSNFYPSPSGMDGSAGTSAAVVCSGEAGTGAQGSPVPITSANKPGQAILTLGTATTENGQSYGQSNKTITIKGGVTSDSNIDASHASLNVIGGAVVKAATGCTTQSGNTITPACTASSGVLDPNYPAPTGTPAPPASTPACNNNNKVAVFLPGRYTTADTFNGCRASWIYLKPGVYYFDFSTGSHVWTATGTTVAGTLVNGGTNPASNQAAPSVPGACVNPITTTSAVGVELVFGGDSQLVFGNGSNSEFCASYSQTSPPTVVYGLKSSLGSGASLVRAQTGCVVNVPPATVCDTISNPSNGSQPLFFFEGFVYLPLGSINISVTNASQPYFNFGIISRALDLSTTGSACGTCAYISLPDNSLGYGTAGTIVDLVVYVCPASSTCSSSTGALVLKVRAIVYDSSGTPTAGQRQIKILSWSRQN